MWKVVWSARMMEGAGMRESTSGNQVNGSTPQRLQEATKLRASPPSCRRCRCRRMSDCLGQCDIAVGPFRGAVVNLQLAVFQEARQRFPLIQRVAYRGPDGLFSRTSACRYRWNLPISRDTLAGWKPALLDGGTVRSCKAGLWPISAKLTCPSCVRSILANSRGRPREMGYDRWTYLRDCVCSLDSHGGLRGRRPNLRKLFEAVLSRSTLFN